MMKVKEDRDNEIMMCVTLPMHGKKYDQDETGLYKSL